MTDPDSSELRKAAAKLVTELVAILIRLHNDDRRSIALVIEDVALAALDDTIEPTRN